MRFAFIAAIILGAVCFTAGSAFAHKQKIASTEVLINERSGFIEISHRFVLHDAEDAIVAQTGRAGDLIGNEADRMAFAKYVADRFDLTAFGFVPRSPTLLGAEVAEGNLFVYQEVPIGRYPGILLVRSDMLREIWPDQVNAVIVRRGRRVKTETFRGTDDVKLIMVQPSQ